MTSMTGLLCVCYILLLLIILAALCGVWLGFYSGWLAMFLLSICFCIVLCGMIGAMDTQLHMLRKRVAELETRQANKQDSEEDMAE